MEGTGFPAEFADKALASFYASPQQKNGHKTCKQDDVYALGVIWYQLACGDFNIGPVTGSAWKKRLQEKGVTEELLIAKKDEYLQKIKVFKTNYPNAFTNLMSIDELLLQT